MAAQHLPRYLDGLAVDKRRTCSNERSAHSFFMRGASCQRKSKRTVRFFDILIQHNSFWSCRVV